MKSWITRKNAFCLPASRSERERTHIANIPRAIENDFLNHGRDGEKEKDTTQQPQPRAAAAAEPAAAAENVIRKAEIVEWAPVKEEHIIIRIVKQKEIPVGEMAESQTGGGAIAKPKTSAATCNQKGKKKEINKTRKRKILTTCTWLLLLVD